jgi:hypothetical protein
VAAEWIRIAIRQAAQMKIFPDDFETRFDEKWA